MRTSLYLFILFSLFCSCAKKPQEEVDEAIDVAQTYLTNGKCDSAIKLLEDVGRQPTDPVYLQVLASAYACRAGFSEISFIDSDLSKIDTATEDFFPSLTTLSTSQETQVDSPAFNDLKTAVNILINVDDNQPSQANRNAIFGDRKASDMAIQTIFLSIAQLGRFLNYYGNVDANGVKGGGGGPNECFISYTATAAQVYLDGTGLGGACNSIATDVGHPELVISAPTLATTRRRMCEGLMIVTNILDIMNSINLPTNSSLLKLEEVITTVNQFKDDVINVNASLGTLLQTTSQATCESLTSSPTEFDNLQYIYAILFEKGLP